MTQEEMAEALNIRLGHLSKMEYGKRKPSIDLIIAMACYFYVSTDYLRMGKDHDMGDSRTRLLDVVTQLTEMRRLFPFWIISKSIVSMKIGYLTVTDG